MQYDVFISHASEDKEGFVRELARALAAERLDVWYDEFSLTVGDSVRSSIDRGLSRSRFGVVVLSPSFFAKRWTEWELDGLVGRQNQGGGNVILPVWHGIGYPEVAAQSPSLANLMAIPSSLGVEEVVRRLVKAIRPQGSTLQIAREFALSRGLDVPAITDDYWLDVVQWAGTDQEGQPWAIPLPQEEGTPQERGLRFGWAALQWNWVSAAWDWRPNSLTPPSEILAFIDEQPGLMEACLHNPEALADYAPLLTIRGVGGPFEGAFDSAMSTSVEERSKRMGKSCDERWALRHETFCGMELYDVMNDLEHRHWGVYQIDYAVWLLSEASAWLPQWVREFLVQAVKEYSSWPNWTGGFYRAYIYQERPHDFILLLLDAYESGDRKVTPEMQGMVEYRLATSVRELGFPESASDLTARFLEAGFFASWFAAQERLAERKANRSRRDEPDPPMSQ